MTTYINVMTAESSELHANDQFAQSKEVLATDLTSLYKELSGWRGIQMMVRSRYPGVLSHAMQT